MVHELLNGLSPDEVNQALALGARVKVHSGASLFRLGDPADRLFLIERGQIRLTLPMQVRGRQEDVLIEEKSPGETVGWSALIPPYRFTLTATASMETEVIGLPREALLKHFESSPLAGRKIALNLAVVVGHRLQLLQAMWLREMQRTVAMHSALAGSSR
ncbi:MAG TPA: cyclic nucleotide-binding domain-containing protein [Candidatus Angelobacter sp.]